MTTAERLNFEGMQQGVQQGMQQEREAVAARLIKVGMDTTAIAQATHLPKQRIQELCGKTNGST